jgi:dihydrodipicolinate synthase/N-acetylneuraminate lyase
VLDIPQIAGAKHSSLSRVEEWDRLALRDRRRPEFMLLTGNDLAIDMVVYGSDYLLGLSTFAPDAFAARDAAWADGDEARFWAINDALQYLGRLAFRAPVPGYRHDAAMFLALRGWLTCDATHPSSPVRPASDRALMAPILDDLGALGALSQ